MSDRPFRFSVSVGSAASRAEWRDKVRQIEGLGFDLLVAPDHLNAAGLSPLVALGSAVEASTSLRFGTLVLNSDLRHPALVARDAATLDLLSDGRFELGLGAGHMEREYDEVGLAFEPAARRVARLAEAVRVIRSLLLGEVTSFEGEHYRIRDHELFPRPGQAPLPLWIGGNGRDLLELAAREASTVGFTGFFARDGGRAVAPTHFTAAGLEDRLAIVRAAAGERFASLELHALLQAVLPARDPRDAARAVLAGAPDLSLDDVLSSPFLLLGSTEAMADALLERRARFGLSHFTVFEPALEPFAAVVARLRGR